MTRKIKAQDVKPGMTVEWTDRNWKHSGTIAKARLLGGAFPFVAFWSAEDKCQTAELDQEVTVLKEAQPEEPNEFGARVVVDGVQFIRRGGDTTYAWEASSGTCFTWDDLLRLGQVAVVPDQGWTVPTDTPEVQAATEPRKWDRWEDVLDMVVVRTKVEQVVVRRAGDRIERLFSNNKWKSSFLTARDLNFFAPFTEVRDVNEAV